MTTLLFSSDRAISNLETMEPIEIKVMLPSDINEY